MNAKAFKPNLNIMAREKIKGWYSRGYLPHFESGSAVQFVTMRLGDSMPQKILAQWRKELELRGAENIEREMLVRIEKFLDSGYGKCCLKKPEIAEIVKASLLKYDDDRYKIFSWVVMPNHVHFLLKPINDWELNQILHSFKSFTALEANRALNRNGKFWMRESFDRRMRDSDHFEKTVRYIHNNPVKAGLCKKASDWKYSSAYVE